MLYFQDNKTGYDYSFKFRELHENFLLSIKESITPCLKIIRKYFKLKGWSHWNKNHLPNSEEKYVTRGIRFPEENKKAEEIIKNNKNCDFIDFIENTWRNHTMPRVFANIDKEVGFLKAQHKLVDMFDQPSSLEISYPIFIEYFNDDNITEKFFDKEDYHLDYEKELITIKN
jgi:hypothetical protein